MNSLELFAGAGGLALGTARAGFRHRLVLEWDKDACDTLRKNYLLNLDHARDWKIIETDVRAFDFRPFAQRVQFVCGGPPCQPFSIGGKPDRPAVGGQPFSIN
jgi:DNA (cytosine-5)-methyltransferase 1